MRLRQPQGPSEVLGTVRQPPATPGRREGKSANIYVQVIIEEHIDKYEQSLSFLWQLLLNRSTDMICQGMCRHE